MSKIQLNENYKDMKGIIEFIIKDKNGNVVGRHVEHNIIKIFAKEMLSHRIPSSEIWNPNANSGLGDWELSGIDLTEEFSARYILFGASFDENNVPLDTDDSRFYQIDTVTGIPAPIRLGPGAEFGGDLINPIPFADPGRPLKRVESITFEPTFQPSFTPFLQDDVRAINNIVVLETTLRLDEYNGFGLTSNDFFTITEVALAGGKRITDLGVTDCEKTPSELFTDGDVQLASAAGTDVVSLDSITGTGGIDNIKAGDQIEIVATDGSEIPQVSPFYLVQSKAAGGKDLVLDRVPTDSDGNAITGDIGVLRSTLRIFSHRILSVPLRKSSSFEIICRWRLIFN